MLPAFSGRVSSPQYLDYPIRYAVDLLAPEMTGAIQNNMSVCRKNTIWSHVALLS